MTDMSINIPIVLGLAAIIMIAVSLYVCIRRRLQAIVKDKKNQSQKSSMVTTQERDS